MLSQTKQEPFATEKDSKVYYIKPISEAPSIDGVLDDAIWSSILPITDFIQEEPDNMAEPTQNTEVYITYDEKALYVAARMYDSEPSNIVRQLAPRDDWYEAFDETADWFSIDLDSRHDHQTAFSFAVNASGVMSDEMIYNDEDYDIDWNAIWHAEVNIDDKGWSVEMEIPFSNLPFYASDKLTWGLNITRFIHNNYETINWVVFPLDIEGIVSKYGHIKGFSGIYPPAKFEFRPYSMSGMTKYSDIRLLKYNVPTSWKEDYYNDSHHRLGIDFNYKINTNSNMTFTVNPDFGQVELDPKEVNLTSYETYFKEKRPFFLKDSDIFNTPIEIFYSRRIGNSASILKYESGKDTLLKSDFVICDSTWYKKNYYTSWWNQELTVSNEEFNIIAKYKNYPMYYESPITIKGASKLTGKTQSGLSYGLLGAVTTLDDDNQWLNQIINGRNRHYLVSRIKQDLFAGNSFIGLMSTSSFADSANTYSIDGMTNLFDNQVGIDGQVIMTSKEHKGFHGEFSLSPPGNFSAWLQYNQFDKGLDINNLGYLWRDDYSQTKLGLRFQTLESWNKIRDASIILEGDIEKNSDGLDLGKTIELGYDIQFMNFWGLGGGIYKISEAFDDREIELWEDNTFGPAVLIPEVSGTYLNITSDLHQRISGSINFTWANNTRNDMERGQLIEMTYKPNSFIDFSISYDHYQRKKKYAYTLDYDPEWDPSLCAEIDTHYIFSSIDEENDQINMQINWTINRQLSIQTYFDYYSIMKTYDQNSYIEYDEINDEFIYSDYIWGTGEYANDSPFYTDDPESIYDANGDLMSILDPNHYIYNYPQYTSLIFNGVIKWNYTKGSNIYFVYSSNKSVNGTSFHGIDGFSDFLRFNEKKRWIEVLRDQTFMIKIDYWFEK